MKIKISKFDLFNAFSNGLPLKDINADIINSIEREDGSNNSYNIKFIDKKGKTLIIHAITK